MSETVKKSMEINSLLEEAEDLSIGAGVKAEHLILSSIISATQPVSIVLISSARPDFNRATVVTRAAR